MKTVGTAKWLREISQGLTYRGMASQLMADERQNVLFFNYRHEHSNMLSNYKKLASTQNKSSMFYLYIYIFIYMYMHIYIHKK